METSGEFPSDYFYETQEVKFVSGDELDSLMADGWMRLTVLQIYKT
jgi:hypothetical protein